MKPVKTIIAMAVLAVMASYAAAGEFETMRMESGVKFNEEIFTQAMEKENTSASFNASPKPAVSGEVKAAQAAPAQAAAPKAGAKAAPVPATPKDTVYIIDHDGDHHHDHDYDHQHYKPNAVSMVAALALVVGVLYLASPVWALVGGALLVTVAVGNILLGKKSPK